MIVYGVNELPPEAPLPAPEPELAAEELMFVAFCIACVCVVREYGEWKLVNVDESSGRMV